MSRCRWSRNRLWWVPVLTMLGAFSLCAEADGKSGERSASNFPRDPVAEVEVCYEGKSRYHRDDDAVVSSGDVGITEVSASVKVPVYMTKRARVMTGLSLKYNHFYFPETDVHSLDTYVISVPVTAMVPISQKWMFMGTVAPGVYSDLTKVGDDDIKFAVMGLFFYRINAELTVAFGAAYSRVFGRDEVFPAVGLVWKPTPEWKISLMYPRPSIMYAPNKRLRLGLLVTPAGDEWDIRDPRPVGDREQYEFSLEGYRFGLGGEYDVGDHWGVRLAAGGTFFRAYKFYDEHDNKVLDADIDDTWMAYGAIYFRR